MGMDSRHDAAPYHTFVLKADGSVAASGLNNAGALGIGIEPTGGWDWFSDFLPVAGLADITALAAGDSHALALDASGNVWAWGDDSRGQLGRGSVLSSTVPTLIPGLSNIVQVSASGAGASLAVDQSGNVWAWGNNYHGQLGDGSGINRSTPVRLTGIEDVQTVSGGDVTSMALKRDGSVWAWGGGQLGNGPWLETGQLTPIPVPGLAGVVEISSAHYHTLARKFDGSVLGWGQAWGSVLGSSNPDPSYSSTDTPVVMPNLGPMQGISAGMQLSALLGSDGLLYMGGANGVGQLGDGTFALHPGFVLAVAPGGAGFLNLDSAGAPRIPPALQTPFFVSSTGGITESSASVAIITKFNPSDAGKPGEVYVTASVPTGSLGVETVALGASKRGPQGAHAFANAAGNSPAGFTLMQLTPTGWQTVSSGQLIPYASGVLGDQLAAQTILNNTDTTALKGAEFCVGYGTSAQDMLSSGNIRAVATIPGATATTSCVVGGTASVNLTVAPGWNLLGNPVSQVMSVAARRSGSSTRPA